MANKDIVVFINKNGDLRSVEAATGSSTNVFDTADEVVAAYQLWEDPPAVTQRSLRHNGVSAMGCFPTDTGKTCFQRRVNTGPGSQRGCKRNVIGPNQTAEAETTVPDAVADAVMAVGVCWPTYKDGQGNQYDSALDDADALVGYPFGTTPI